MRCHECQVFGHVKSEYPNLKRDLSKAINATFTDDESCSDNQIEKSSHDETGNYMAFTSVVKSHLRIEREREREI